MSPGTFVDRKSIRKVKDQIPVASWTFRYTNPKTNRLIVERKGPPAPHTQLMLQTVKTSLSGQHPDSDQEPGLLIILLGLIRRLVLTGLITAAVCSVCWFGMQMRLGRFDPDILEAAGWDGIGVLATGRISGKWTFDDLHPLEFYQKQLAIGALPEDADHEMGAALLMSQWVEHSTSGGQQPEGNFCKDTLLWAASAVAREPHSVLRR